MGLLSSLFADPTAANGGGGWLLNLIDPQAAAALQASAGNTPIAAPSSPGAPGGAPTPPPAAQNTGLLSKFFSPTRGSLGGNSFLGDAIRGGLAGLGSSTGYTGLAALGQGAMGSIQAENQRRQQQMGSIMAGQQYQQGQNQLAYQPAMLKQQYLTGQQGLAQGQLGLQWRADMLNDIWAQQNPGQTNPHPYTVADILADPSLAGATQLPAQTGQGAPPQAAQPQAPQQPVGMAPVVGGQPSPGQAPINPQVAAAYPQGGSVPGFASGGPQPNANSQGIVTPTPQQQQPQEPQPTQAPALPPVPPELQHALRMAQYSADPKTISEAETKIFEYQHAAQQAASTQDALQFSPSGINKNLAELGTRFESLPQVKTFREAKPIYDEAVAADTAHKTAQTQDEQLSSDADLANAAIKMMNPNSSNLRANSIDTVEEAKGWEAMKEKVLQSIRGGSALTKEMRQTLMNVIQRHYDAYQSAYDPVVSNYKKQAQLYVPKGQTVDQGQWDSSYTAAPVAVVKPSSPEAQTYLKLHPETKGEFDAWYGQGAAAQILGN
jgi:hypothetical protein